MSLEIVRYKESEEVVCTVLSSSQSQRISFFLLLNIDFLVCGVFLDALASLRSKLRLTESPTGQTQIAKITTESISENELRLCQYH